MPNLAIRYVLYIPRKSRRSGQPTTEILYEVNTTILGSGTAGATPAPRNFPLDKDRGDAIFGFWFFTGSNPGNFKQLALIPPTLIQNGMDITMTAWYFLSGPGTGDGITLDAFNTKIGDVFNDTFVQSVNPDNSLLSNANEGFLEITRNETVVALNSSSPSRGNFNEWTVVFGESQSINNRDLTLGNGSTSTVFAFYDFDDANLNLNNIPDLVALFVSAGVSRGGSGFTVLHGGTVIHNPPRGPLTSLFHIINLINSADKLDSHIRNEIIDIALKQLSITSKEIKKLKEKE